MGGISRRRVPRRKIQQRVGLLVGGSYSVTDAHELGEGGILLSYSGNLDVGQRVVVTFDVDGSSKVVTTGVVRYGRPDGAKRIQYGIEFDRLDFKIKRLIRNFVAAWSQTDPQQEEFSSWKDRA